MGWGGEGADAAVDSSETERWAADVAKVDAPAGERGSVAPMV